MTTVNPIPDNYPRLTPYLHMDGAAAAIDFYVRVLDAVERMRLPTPEGKLAHAEIEIGNSVIMLADEFPDMGALGPKSVGGTPVMLMVYVEDVDSVFDKAVQAGAMSLSPVENQFYGDRTGQFEDPFGHRWTVATHVEDIAPEEMQRRAQAAMGS